ncbi:MAG: FAD-dependent oxidoreductase, partial [bacterium]|nr:FAD-dependent oxidoreductase [bacterium]
LIYPVPDPRFPFLGVHFTRMIHGGVEAGPNAVFAFKREGYKKTDFSFKDNFEMLTYKGFWKMISKHWRMGVGEMYRSLNKAAFTRALQRLLPEIRKQDLKPGGAGVRAQALEPDGFLVDDFRIKEVENMVHVLNAPSPAATASINIGKSIAAIALKNFNL